MAEVIAWPFLSTIVRLTDCEPREKASSAAKLPSWQLDEDEQGVQAVELVLEEKEPAGQGEQTLVAPVTLEAVPF